VFAVAGDMPCLDRDTINVLAGQAEKADVVIASLSTGVQPMHAVYGKACLPILEHMMDEGDLKIQNLLNHPSLRVQYVDEAVLRAVDPQLRSFININTPADLEMVRKLLVARTHASPPRH
jgi:molybdopterin-guanine dinucleotide biosynthesis protein A